MSFNDSKSSVRVRAERKFKCDCWPLSSIHRNRSSWSLAPPYRHHHHHHHRRHLTNSDEPDGRTIASPRRQDESGLFEFLGLALPATLYIMNKYLWFRVVGSKEEEKTSTKEYPTRGNDDSIVYQLSSRDQTAICTPLVMFQNDPGGGWRGSPETAASPPSIGQWFISDDDDYENDQCAVRYWLVFVAAMGFGSILYFFFQLGVWDTKNGLGIDDGRVQLEGINKY